MICGAPGAGRVEAADKGRGTKVPRSCRRELFISGRGKERRSVTQAPTTAGVADSGLARVGAGGYSSSNWRPHPHSLPATNALPCNTLCTAGTAAPLCDTRSTARLCGQGPADRRPDSLSCCRLLSPVCFFAPSTADRLDTGVSSVAMPSARTDRPYSPVRRWTRSRLVRLETGTLPARHE